MDKAIKIILVDDHAAVRDGITSMLVEYGFKNIQHAADGLQLLAMVNAGNPDLILMDINMPRLNGIAATQTIKKRAPQIKIIGLSVGGSIMMKMMNEAGADGFVRKDEAPERLCPEIERVCA